MTDEQRLKLEAELLKQIMSCESIITYQDVIKVEGVAATFVECILIYLDIEASWSEVYECVKRAADTYMRIKKCKEGLK